MRTMCGIVITRLGSRTRHGNLRRHLGRAAARLRLPLEIRLVVQARNPEHEANQEEEQEHGYRDDFRRKAEGWRERVDGLVANDAVDMPVLAQPGANIAHEAHEPGEGDGD